MKVTVTITLKPGVLDPQGRAIESSLAGLGYKGIGDVATGKQITLDIDEADEAKARRKVAEMCEALLVNTVIEDYEIHCHAKGGKGGA